MNWRCGLALFLTFPAWAHDPITTKLTWSREVIRIVNRRCLGCHGANASVPLADYESARPWAKAIRDQVMTRRMPPWGVVPGFGVPLQGDPSLTQAEIDTFIHWVEGGSPKGDDLWLPPQAAETPLRRPRLPDPLFAITGHWRAPRDSTLTGVRADGMKLSGEMRITVSRPDGAVTPVIWLRELPTSSADFVFSKPLAIQKDAVLHLETGPDAVANLAITPLPVSSPPPPGKANLKQTPHRPAH